MMQAKQGFKQVSTFGSSVFKRIRTHAPSDFNGLYLIYLGIIFEEFQSLNGFSGFKFAQAAFQDLMKNTRFIGGESLKMLQSRRINKTLRNSKFD